MTLELDSLHIWMAGSDVAFGTPPVLSAADTDSVANTTNWLADSASHLISVRTRNELFNGATWDRIRAIEEGTLLVSAARTVQTDVPLTNVNARGIWMFLDVTAVPGLGSIKMRISWQDPVTAKKFTMGTSGAGITTVSSNIAFAGNCGGVAGAPGDLFFLEPLPRSLVISIVPATADSYTYSLGYALAY